MVTDATIVFLIQTLGAEKCRERKCATIGCVGCLVGSANPDVHSGGFVIIFGLLGITERPTFIVLSTSGYSSELGSSVSCMQVQY